MLFDGIVRLTGALAVHLLLFSPVQSLISTITIRNVHRKDRAITDSDRIPVSAGTGTLGDPMHAVVMKSVIISIK